MFEIIHPNFFRNLMFQRPHQLLKEFSRQGYKTIFYNINAKTESIDTVGDFHIYNKTFPPLIKHRKRILWIAYPPLYKEIGKYNEDLVVYDCIDYPDQQFRHWQSGLDQLREKANLILATSEVLYDFNNDYKCKTFMCRNGADFEHFSKAKAIKLHSPNDISKIKTPIIGYFGALAEWVDWNLIGYLARKNEFSIVLIGPLFNISENPISLKNVFFLGKKEYENLPNYLQSFDVCIIPFLKSILTDACNPVKMYEYLSAGKPVVSTDLGECRIEVVKYSKTYQEFYNNIVDSLKDSDAENIESRMAFAKENSWESRVKYIRSIIEPMLSEPRFVGLKDVQD